MLAFVGFRRRFRRLSIQNQFPGIGIDRVTIQRIVQRHGGRIEE